MAGLLTFNLQEQPYTLFPDNHQIPLYTSTKTGPWYAMNVTNMDTHKQDADEKKFAEIVEKKITQVTKQINAQMNLSF